MSSLPESAPTPPQPSRGRIARIIARTSSRPAADESGSAEEILRQAAALGIPWRRILEAEIVAEKSLRRNQAELDDASDPWQALCVLSRSSLRSWRVRDWVESLCWEAAANQSAPALRRLKRFLQELSGNRPADSSLVAARREHMRVAYLRVLELMTISQAAERASGAASEKTREVAASTGCAREDAEWAVRRASSSGRRQRLDDAVRRAREEGFQIPLAGSEPRAFRMLKRCVGTVDQPRAGARRD